MHGLYQTGERGEERERHGLEMALVAYLCCRQWQTPYHEDSK
jgi:hypothetical protein